MICYCWKSLFFTCMKCPVTFYVKMVNSVEAKDVVLFDKWYVDAMPIWYRSYVLLPFCVLSPAIVYCGDSSSLVLFFFFSFFLSLKEKYSQFWRLSMWWNLCNVCFSRTVHRTSCIYSCWLLCSISHTIFTFQFDCLVLPLIRLF